MITAQTQTKPKKRASNSAKKKFPLPERTPEGPPDKMPWGRGARLAAKSSPKRKMRDDRGGWLHVTTGGKTERTSMSTTATPTSEADDVMQLSYAGSDETRESTTSGNSTPRRAKERGSSPMLSDASDNDQDSRTDETSEEAGVPEHIVLEFQKLGSVDQSSIEKIYNLIRTHVESSRKKQDSASLVDIQLSKSSVGWVEKLRKDRMDDAKRKRRDSKPRLTGGHSEGKMDAWAERRMKTGLSRRKSMPADLLRKTVDKTKSEWSKDGTLVRMRLTRSKSARFSRNAASPIRRVPESAPEVRKQQKDGAQKKLTQISPNTKKEKALTPFMRGLKDEKSRAKEIPTDMPTISRSKSVPIQKQKAKRGKQMQQKQRLQQESEYGTSKNFSLFSGPTIAGSGSTLDEMLRKRLEADMISGKLSKPRRKSSKTGDFPSWSPVCVSDADA